MKYSFELKKEIYKKHCEGYGSEILSKEYGINASKIRYMCRLVDKHGLEAIWHKFPSILPSINLLQLCVYWKTVKVLNQSPLILD